MGMAIKYGPADYEARLNGGVILYNGIPCRVQVDGHQINITDLTSSRHVARNVDPLDENIDISAPELGFMNTPTCAVYLERIPRRRYKQALEAASVLETVLRRNGPVQEVPAGRGASIYSDDFRKMFTQRYPSFDEAVSRIVSEDSEVQSVALSRKVAITGDDFGRLTVWYKGRVGDTPVGWIDPGSRTVKVPSTEKAWVVSMHLQGLDWEVE